jgi:hypothetical protein
MGFLFFGKKKSVKAALDNINHISDNLKHSFTRIKSDIKVVRDWLSFFKTKNEEYEDRFKNLDSRIDELGQVITYLTQKDQIYEQQIQNTPKPQKEKPYYEIGSNSMPPIAEKTLIDDLTETQKIMFFRLGAFQRESGQQWTSLKVLAQDLYPGKPYDKVRSTVSEYVGILVDAGLIHKMRKGKQTYIAITQKGQEFFKKNNPKPKKKPLQKSK